jgi:hypothetical protein
VTARPPALRPLLAALLVLGCALVACGHGADGPADVAADAAPLADVALDAAADARPDAADAALADIPPAEDVPPDDTPAGDAADVGPDVPVAPLPCTTDAHCAGRLPGLAPCRRAGCDRQTGFCAPVPDDDGAACDDRDACTLDTVCAAGVCVGRPVPCDDGVYCTVDRCVPATGCEHVPRAAACDDGDPCTAGDACEAGTCRPGANVCPCTADADCAAFLAERAGGDACAGPLVCGPGGCVVDRAARPPCPVPTDACRLAVCDPTSGACALVPHPDGFPCDDGDACTAPDACAGGRCAPGPTRVCDDANPCTTDRCDAVAGCLHAPNQRACDDGDGCTETDRCEEGLCLPGGNNECLDETCTPGPILRCGEIVRGTRAGAGVADLLADYPCPPPPTGGHVSTADLGGPELTWVLIAPFDGAATVALPEGAAETRAVVLEAARRGCDTGACRVAAAPSAPASFALTAGRTYYVVVDAPSGVAPEYALRLDCLAAAERACADGVDEDGDGQTDCDDPDCAAACRAAATCPVRWWLGCGQPVAGRSDDAGHTRREEVYGCVAGAPTLPGPEVRYAFRPPAAGTYRARLDGVTGPLEVIALDAGEDACAPGACRARGLGGVEFEGIAGRPVALVVDGPDPVGAAFTLTIECPADVEGDCADGRDDDGDGATDCADDDCAAAPGCSGGLCRPATTPLTCGDVVSGVTSGAGHTATLEGYACSLFRFTGPEQAFALDVPPDTLLVARLLAGAPELDVFVLAPEAGGDCAPAVCVSQGDDVAEARIAAGRQGIVVVDGHDGAAGPFTLGIECRATSETECTDGRDDDGDGRTDCADEDCLGTTACPSCANLVTEDLVCGDARAISTLAGAATTAIPAWGCSANPYPGPERVFGFTPVRGGYVTITLEDETGGLDVLLLEDRGAGCNPAACLRWSPYRVRWRVDGGRRYYVAVDGYAGATGSATLRLLCD